MALTGRRRDYGVHSVNFPTNEVIAEGRGNDHEESFDAAYKAWTEAAAAAKTVALENEGLRERLRDLEQQVEKSTAPVHSETQSEDPAPATAPAPKRRRSGVKKSTTTQPDF